MKKLISSLVILSILLGVFGISLAETKFTDVKDNAWYKDSVYALVATGAIAGNSDGTFKPNASITVKEFIKILVLAAGNKVEKGKGSNWAQPYITFSIATGLVEQSEFASYNRPITRGEIARMLVRSLKGAEYPADVGAYSKQIKDYEATEYKFQQYILKAYVTGLMAGNTDGTFKYKIAASRAEASAMVVRLIDKEKRLKVKNPDGGTNVETVSDKPKHEDFISINPDVPKELYEYDYNKEAVPGIINNDDGTTTTMNQFTTNVQLSKMMKQDPDCDIYNASDIAKRYKTISDTVNYKTIGNDYKKALLNFFNCSGERETWADNWITEVKKNTIVEESKFITDPSLVYRDCAGSLRVRGRFMFIYHNPTNKDYLKDKSYETDRWYYQDIEILLSSGMHLTNGDMWKHADLVFRKRINLTTLKVLGG